MDYLTGPSPGVGGLLQLAIMLTIRVMGIAHPSNDRLVS